MIEFTFWDIVRNLLLATRWTVLLSLAAQGDVVESLVEPVFQQFSEALRGEGGDQE